MCVFVGESEKLCFLGRDRSIYEYSFARALGRREETHIVGCRRILNIDNSALSFEEKAKRQKKPLMERPAQLKSFGVMGEPVIEDVSEAASAFLHTRRTLDRRGPIWWRVSQLDRQLVCKC